MIRWPRHYKPTDAERVEILRRLLALARAGKCGAVHCTGHFLSLRLDIYGNCWPLNWGEALALCEKLEAPPAVAAAAPARKGPGKQERPALVRRRRA